MSAAAPIKVLGDLAKTGRLGARGQDTAGDTGGLITGEYSVLFDWATGAPEWKDVKLPAGMPAMNLESYRDTREGPLWKRTFKLAAAALQKTDGTSSYEPRTRENPIYTLAVTLEDRPIALHPNIAMLLATYAGTAAADGTVEFARTYTAGGGGLTAGGAATPNPMWGVKTYKSATVMFTSRWLWQGSKDKPWPDEILLAGTIDAEPFNAPKFKGGRNWLYLGCNSTVRGTSFEMEESWLLSSAGGWMTEIYGLAALEFQGKSKK